MTLLRERERLAEAVQAFEHELEFLDRYLPTDKDDAKIVYLSARGFKLATHLHVIRAVESSMLASMFDRERWHEQVEDVDSEGNIFMEYASSYSMGKILDLLRQRVRYGMKYRSVDLCDGRRAEFEALTHYLFPGVEASIVPNCPLDSTIIKSELVDAFTPLVVQARPLLLLYRASRDAGAATAFIKPVTGGATRWSSFGPRLVMCSVASRTSPGPPPLKNKLIPSMRQLMLSLATYNCISPSPARHHSSSP